MNKNLNIDSAHYGYLTTDRQKKRFYQVKRLEKAAFLFYKIGWHKTYHFLDQRIIIPFGKWYI